MTRKQLEKVYDKKFAQAGDTNEDFEEFLIEEITLFKDKVKRRNKQIKNLKKELKELTIKHQKFIKDLQKNTKELNR